MKILRFDGVAEAYWLENRLMCEISKNCNIRMELGRVKKKNDGRWNWFYKSSDNQFVKEIEPTKTQGTCATEEEAKEQLERMWEYK